MSIALPEFFPPTMNPVPIKPIEDVIKPDDIFKSFLRDEMEMRSLRILDIGYIAVLYFIFGLICSVSIDRVYGNWTMAREEQKSTFRVGIELLGMIWLFGILTYVIRHLVELIPSPISYIPLSNPSRKFNHLSVRELSSATVFTLILMGTSYHFRKKLEYFYKRITGRLYIQNGQMFPL
jgi:hypothetical protein